MERSIHQSGTPQEDGSEYLALFPPPRNTVIYTSGGVPSSLGGAGGTVPPNGGGGGGCTFIDPYLYGCPGGYVSHARVVDAVPEYPVRVCGHVNREPVNLLVTGEHVADICTDCEAALPLLPHTRV